MWSKAPWDTPMIKINSKQIGVEIIKSFNFKTNNEKKLQNKKKIKEWFKFIFIILLFIVKIIVLKISI